MAAVRVKKRKRNYVYNLERGPKDVVFRVINATVFILFSLVCVFPFYYIFINTVSDNDLVAKGLITVIPRGIHFNNYVMLRYVNDLFNSVLVTVIRTFVGTAAMVMASSFTGYIVANRKTWLRKFCYRFLIIPMYFNAGLIPWYLNMLSLGLTNNFLGYILPGLIVPFNIILVKTYIESIPSDIAESASIDGAGVLMIYFRIIFPLSVPILATISIFGAVNNWNAFQDSLILMQGSPGLYTLQHRLYTYLTTSTNLEAMMRSGATNTDLKETLNVRVVQYTISMVSILPIIFVYPFMQRYFVKGIMMGAVKG